MIASLEISTLGSPALGWRSRRWDLPLWTTLDLVWTCDVETPNQHIVMHFRDFDVAGPDLDSRILRGSRQSRGLPPTKKKERPHDGAGVPFFVNPVFSYDLKLGLFRVSTSGSGTQVMLLYVIPLSVVPDGNGRL